MGYGIILYILCVCKDGHRGGGEMLNDVLSQDTDLTSLPYKSIVAMVSFNVWFNIYIWLCIK